VNLGYIQRYVKQSPKPQNEKDVLSSFNLYKYFEKNIHTEINNALILNRIQNAMTLNKKIKHEIKLNIKRHSSCEASWDLI
jgi:hypothetical protein